MNFDIVSDFEFRISNLPFRLGLVGVVLLVAACANIYTARGVYHRVQKGETLASLARRHHTSLQELAELNNLEDPGGLKVGQSIFIPGARLGGGRLPGGYKVAKQQGRREGKRGVRPAASLIPSRVEPRGIEVDHKKFSWPVGGDISSLYGIRRGRRHDGIDIRSPRGTPVHAAADGEVVYSKRLRGYGNLILLKHQGDFFTVYAHNSVNLAKKGARIRRGQVIAKVGSTGRSTGPHVHFEVREGSRPRNPLFFLPSRTETAKALRKGSDQEIGGE